MEPLFVEPPADAGPMDDVDKWEAQHVPMCNAGCWGDSHHLQQWTPDPSRHQLDAG